MNSSMKSMKKLLRKQQTCIICGIIYEVVLTAEQRSGTFRIHSIDWPSFSEGPRQAELKQVDTKLRLQWPQTNEFNTAVGNPFTPEHFSSRKSLDHIGLVFPDPTEASSCHRHSSHPLSCSNSWWNINARHDDIIHLCQLFTENTEMTLWKWGHMHTLKVYASDCHYVYSVIKSKLLIKVF